MRPFFFATAALCAALPLGAQDQASARVASQYVQYKLGGTVDQTISELAIPVFVVVPVTSMMTVDVGTAYVQSQVKGGGFTSTINGFTDTQVRGNFALGTDAVILTLGVNVPTGKETATVDQFDAATRIGSDLLSFPITNLGTGLGGTGGLAFARSVGSWNVGAGGSVRLTQAYKPLRFAADSSLRYQPGNEYRARIGADRTVGSGMVALGFTYSRFGRDSVANSVYNSGDRYLGQVAWSTQVGSSSMTLVGWNLYRGAGTQGRTQHVPWENLTSGSVGFAFPMGRLSFEPSVQARYWLQRVDANGSVAGRTDKSVIAEGELRLRIPMGAMALVPAVGYAGGNLALGPGSTAPITGFRGSVGLQLR